MALINTNPKPIRVGDLVYWEEETFKKGVSGKRRYCKVTEVIEKDSGKTEIWGWWVDNKEDALKKNSGCKGYCWNDVVFIDTPMSWKQRIADKD